VYAGFELGLEKSISDSVPGRGARISDEGTALVHVPFARLGPALQTFTPAGSALSLRQSQYSLDYAKNKRG
jgi:hypothetical protein